MKTMKMFWKKLFKEKIKPKIEYIGLTTFEESNIFTGKIISKRRVGVFRRSLNGTSKEIFAKVDGETFYFDCEIFDYTRRLVRI